MLPRLRDIMLWSSALIVVMIGLTLYFLNDRIHFYLSTKDIAASPLGTFDLGNDTPAKPNVDLGFVSFHLELSPQAIIKKSDSSVTIKDQGRTLVINLPEILGEMKPNPSFPNDLHDLDRLIEKYGNSLRAQKAAFEFKGGMNVLFCSENDFKCYESLVLIRAVSAPIFEKREFLSATSYDAIIDTLRGKNSKTLSISWTTTQGKRIDQRRGVIMIGDKSTSQETTWPKRFLHSMIIHPAGNILPVEEMVTRVETLRQSPPIRSGG